MFNFQSRNCCNEHNKTDYKHQALDTLPQLAFVVSNQARDLSIWMITRVNLVFDFLLHLKTDSFLELLFFLDALFEILHNDVDVRGSKLFY